MIRFLCIFIAAATVSGCTLPAAAPDAGPDAAEDSQDAGDVPDGSTGSNEDAGTAAPDAGEPDAGLTSDDAGVQDAGLALPGPNGVWLTRNYVAYSAFYDPSVVNDLLARMNALYQVGDLFVNSDRVGADGRLISPPPHIADFLNNVSKWEQQNGARFRVFAWVSGNTVGDATLAPLDVTKPDVRKAVVEECVKLLSPTAPGSYAATATRPYDGVQIDFEPSGMDEVRFSGLLALMEELRAGLSAAGRADALLSFAAHRIGNLNSYYWSPAFYYAMASRVEVLASMTYNSGSTTGAAYQGWMKNQVTSVLRATYGNAWSDGSHPPPTNGVRVLFGLPAYPANANHDPTAETIQYGALGIQDGLAALDSTSDPARSLFGGPAVYLHTKGTTADGYARWDTEWWWFGHYYLQAW